MHYHIEFLDDLNTIVCMMQTTAESPATAFQIVIESGWPPGGVIARVVDEYGHFFVFGSHDDFCS